MRRNRSADNGLNVFMIVKVVRAAETLGLDRISLNLAVYRNAIERGDKIGAGPTLRAGRWLLGSPVGGGNRDPCTGST